MYTTPQPYFSWVKKEGGWVWKREASGGIEHTWCEWHWREGGVEGGCSSILLPCAHNLQVSSPTGRREVPIKLSNLLIVLGVAALRVSVP